MEETLDSVLAQEGVDLTVRIVDNRSDDATIAIAERYVAADRRVSLAVNPVDVNYYGSLNRMLAETEAEFYVPFASDDTMLPGNLARKAEALVETGAGFAHSSAFTIDAASRITKLFPDHEATAPVLDAPAFFSTIARENNVSPAAVMARTSALREVGGFDSRPIYCTDWLTWLRLSLRHRVVTLAEPLVGYRVHEQAGTEAAHRDQINARDWPATIDRLFSDDAMPPGWATWRRMLVAVAYRQQGGLHYKSGIRRCTDGWAAYMLMMRALARHSDKPGILADYVWTVEGAGLAAPPLPVEAVLIEEGDGFERWAPDIERTVEELAPILARVIVGIAPDRVDAVSSVLEPVFGDSALDVVLTPVADPFTLLTPGRLALAPWGSPLVASAEAIGVPVHPYGIPDPFAREPDLEMWEAMDPAACLPATRAPAGASQPR